MTQQNARKNSFLDWVIARPAVDFVLPLLAFSLWSLTGWWVPSNPDVSDSFYTGVTATAGIILAASTFVATQIYYSQGRYVGILRKDYPDELLRNWTQILASLLLSTLLPLGSVLLNTGAPRLAFGLALLSIALAAARSMRVVWWFRLIHGLMVESERDANRPTATLKDPRGD